MVRKFAFIDFVKNPEEICIKYNFIKKGPKIIKNWYVEKFNPYYIEEVKAGNAEGFIVKISVTLEEAEQNPKKALLLTEKALLDLKNLGVEIISPPKNVKFDFPKNIPWANSSKIFIFFIMSAIRKALKCIGKNLKIAEILIIDGDKNYVLALIDLIYPHVNNLSIITNEYDDITYNSKAAEIFSDCGLDIFIKEKSQMLLENADIVINTSDKNYHLENLMKNGGVYFSLKGNKEIDANIAKKRNDLTIANNLKINFLGEKIFLDVFETYYYVISKRYQYFFHRGYNERIVSEVFKEIQTFNSGMPILTFSNP